jgi:hypothetical protein
MRSRLDWVDISAAKYAVMRWHYSRSLSSARNVYIGVWEDDSFIGAVVFGIGAGAATSGLRFGVDRTGDVAELTRIALRRDHKTPVSRILAVAVRMLRRQSPGLRLLISFADPARGHHGGIYQAAGWIYAGHTKPDVQYKLGRKWVHHRTATSSGSAAGLPSRKTPSKHRYLLPLDAEMRDRIAPLSQPYPKRVKQATDGHPPFSGGAAPTHTLQPMRGLADAA